MPPGVYGKDVAGGQSKYTVLLHSERVYGSVMEVSGGQDAVVP